MQSQALRPWDRGRK